MTDGSTRRATLLRWLPAIVWMVVIFVLSSVSGLRVSDDAAVDRPVRATAHLLAFGTLAALLLLALVGRARPRVWHVATAYALTIIYAASDEIHQAFVPGRTGRAQDVAIDAIGAAAGLSFAYLGLWLWSRVDQRQS